MVWRRATSLLAGLGALTTALVAVVAVGIAVGSGSAGSSADMPPPAFEIRGKSIVIGQFSLTTLHDRATLDQIEEARVDVFDQCMADRGFVESPTGDSDAGVDQYSLAFEAAAYGPDAWEVGPPVVHLPDGTTTADGVVWQPGSCAYAQDDAFGIDPHLREALRVRLMTLRSSADQATIEDPAFDHFFEQWRECSGSDDKIALLEALDPVSWTTGDVRPGRRAGSAERGCVTDGARSELSQIRGLHHARVAEANLQVVEAWIDLVDGQAAAVATSSG